MKTNKPNALLVTENKCDINKPVMYFTAEPTSAAHHSQLIKESFNKKMYFEPNTLVICLETKVGTYGINVRILEPSSGKEVWVISSSVKSP